MSKHTVHCYVFDTLADWEYGFAVAGINNTQFHRVPNEWQVRTVAPGRDPIVTSGGVIQRMRDSPVTVQRVGEPAVTRSVERPSGVLPILAFVVVVLALVVYLVAAA